MLEQYFQPQERVYWWRSRAFKIGLAILVGLAVLTAVLFSEQLGDLLRLFGIRAGVGQTITLHGGATNAAEGTYNFMEGADTIPVGSIDVNPVNNRLTLQPPAMLEPED